MAVPTTHAEFSKIAGTFRNAMIPGKITHITHNNMQLS